MSLIYKTTFRVRHYECDAYGHLNNANYLRYMEQAAIEASAAVGYDDARYAALGTHWLIHETDIEYLLPLLAGEAVVVTTWVADFRRVRSLRRYEFTRVGDGALVARAATDWAYLDRASGRPLAIPGEMVTAFSPEGGHEPSDGHHESRPDSVGTAFMPSAASPFATSPSEPSSSSPARAPFPPQPAPPPQPFTLARRVEWRDIDMAQHVNNANYLSYMEEAGVESLGAFGWSMARLIEEDIAIVARRHRIAYQGQAKLGDVLRVTTFLAEVRRATAVRHFTITRESDGAAIARAYSNWVFVHPSSGQIARVPEHLTSDFVGHIVV
jgi:acyl-CoA thioester hydrolase